jgi:hypothetical protein
MKTNKEEFEELINKCFSELSIAAKEKYDLDKAALTAALFLKAQFQLAVFISDIELKARHSKNDITRIEAQKYFECKEAAAGKKLTEAALTNLVAKDTDVIEAKKANSEAEAELKKYNYLMSSIKDGHIFYRSLGKKAWNE